MNILYHHRTQGEDAQGIHIQEMVAAFRALGHSVFMTALVQPGNRSAPGILARIRRAAVKRTPAWIYELMSLSYNSIGYRNLCRAIRRHRPAFIYERYSLNTLCGIWASRRFDIPLILEVNAPLYYEQQQLGRLFFKQIAKTTERWICSQATKTITVTAVMKRMLESEGVPSQKLVVMHNGVDPGRFNPDISGEEVRARYHLRGKMVIGFVGWYRPWHGLDMMLQAVRHIISKDRRIHILLIGDGPSFQQLRDYCAGANMLDSVTFTGGVTRESLPRHIAAVDIAVQPSATEYACPMKIIEYMAMGKCIIAPDQENIRELMGNDSCGILFAPGNPDDFRSKLLELIQCSEKRSTAANFAFARWKEEGLLWQSNASRVLSIMGFKE